MTLNQVPVGTTARLVATDTHPSSRRLAELGLRPGAHVQIMRRTSGGGRLVGIGPSRMALDGASLTAIHVELPA